MFPYSSVFVLAWCLASASASAPIVSLDYGTFLGAKDGNITKFLGVPFAAPTGRFELPQHPKPLEGLQNATQFAPVCPQQALQPIPGFPTVDFPSISEACLYLDVYAPPFGSHSELPVLVWLYGGGFETGYTNETDVRGTVEYSILVNQPVIIVVPAYRLSAFGFLSSKEAQAAGISNLGLRDQLFALEWVQNYISAFGGDPARVVLGGVSAGAASTGFHLLNNKVTSSSLFRGVFMVSPPLVPVPTEADGQGDYDQLVAATNCTRAHDTLQCLKQAPYDVLLDAVNQTPNVFSAEGFILNWSPHIDGELVLENPYLSVKNGNYKRIPILAGDTDDEGSLWGFVTTNITTDSLYEGYLKQICLPEATAAQISDVLRLYPADPTQGCPFDTGTANALTPEFKRLAALLGDLHLTGPRRWLVEHASKTQNVWSWLSKRGKDTPYLGAYHTSDEPLWFPIVNSSTPTDTVGVSALVNFLNTLDPNVPSAKAYHSARLPIEWPTYETPSLAGNSSLLTFSDPLIVNVTADDFRAEAIALLNKLNLQGASVTH